MQAVFNIDLDSFDDDDALLNWEQYEGGSLHSAVMLWFGQQ